MTPDLVVTGGTLVDDTPADIWVESGRVLAITAERPDPSWPTLDAVGLLVAPGYIDLQINGGWGRDFASDPHTMWEVAAALPARGVTSFLPTIVSSPPETIAAAQTAVREPRAGGARPLGLHLEGPMINPDRRGAHPAHHLASPSLDLVAGWSRETGVLMVTLAPELDGAAAVTCALVDCGVVVAAGHSDATAAELGAAIDAGLSHVTHLFNAMAPLHHREPGLIGTVLGRPETTAGIIVDGIHVHPDVVAMAWRAKGPTGLALVSDATAALGMPPSDYALGDTDVTIGAAGARTADGVLAGSTIGLDEAVRNLRAYTGCAVADAVAAASATPAQIIGATSKGTIAPGADADIVLLTEELNVEATIVGGVVAWKS